MQIRNICRINYQHAATDDEPLIHEVVYSNQVQTTMIDKRIKAFKIVDKDQALFFEQLTYTIEIQNISNHDIPFCYFKDELACNLIFKKGSVLVDGMSLYQANPQCGFYIFDLLAQGKKTITFKVIVDYCSKKQTILNKALVEYPHEYKILEKPIHMIEESNLTFTPVMSRQLTFYNINQFVLGPLVNRYRLVNMETCIESQRIKISPIFYKGELASYSVVVTAKINVKLYFKPQLNRDFKLCNPILVSRSSQMTKCLNLTSCELMNLDTKVLKLYFCEAFAYQSGLRGIYIKFKFLLAINSI